MHDGQRLTYEDLQTAARRAYEASGRTQEELAAALGATQSAVSQALSTAGPKFAQLQRRLIAQLTPYDVEEDVRFVVRRRDA